ncbi:serine/threonine-protein phosphatase [Spirosoma sp. KCTC 42546]|uniref:PP2C family protein-serine/threonine phosphatase n=1 Tax=Spirosoma sp. KCTC 42546 TaxID=2520506 RepID=UPI00115B2EAB|nr:protein phosphatase 2C domain-containing protein [Spirosoma sp. KCTC 42546]QDK78880.1 serine/threonine-protein phosphatase [Spirosoma sp. KCTC 42546]
MQIHPSLPIAFSHIGQRTINQDTLYPARRTATEDTQLFIVCDGMGGADKGEVASQLLCDSIVRYATSMDCPIFDSVHIQAALDLAYQAYYTYLNQQPLVSRMGSTLALLQFHKRGATVAHIGDSRVYQLREGKIIFQTQDHRQVNDMVESGIITAAQALTHPWRNRLSRAVVVSAADKNGPMNPPTPDITVLTDVRAGDYFFMCTDGVLEKIDDYVLSTLLAGDMPDQAKIGSLQALCDGGTKDNYSGYLIGISHVTQTEPVRSVNAF